MAVDIRFYKTDGTLLSLDKTTGGYDFGIVRKSQYQVVPVVVKNLGTDDAKNVYVSGSALHTPIEVPTSDYNNEVLAGHWKTFSMLPDGDFTSTLSLPNIIAGKTMLGKKKYIESFTNPTNSAWKNDTITGHNYNWTGSSVIVSDTSGTNKIFGYMDATGWGANKEIDVTFKLNIPVTTVAGSAFIMLGLRKNALGDNKGYLLNIKRLATATSSGTMFFEVRKGEGIKSTGATDFGTVLASTPSVPWIDYTPIRIKLTTNASNLPELKVWVTNVKDTDTPINWGLTTPTSSWVDTANTYPYSGLISCNFGSAGTNIIGSNTFELQQVSLLTDDVDGKVYIRTLVGDGALDSVRYNSAMELYYDPV